LSKYSLTTTGLTPAARASCSSERFAGAQLALVNHGEERLLKETVLLGQRRADAVEAIVLRRFADNAPGAFGLDQNPALTDATAGAARLCG
jgi:hypothetical protein